MPEKVVECARSACIETTEELNNGGFDTASGLLNHCRVLLIGGGIGVAPVAGFAETLADGTYDFYASFKSGSYGLENIKPDKLVITIF